MSQIGRASLAKIVEKYEPLISDLNFFGIPIMKLTKKELQCTIVYMNKALTEQREAALKDRLRNVN